MAQILYKHSLLYVIFSSQFNTMKQSRHVLLFLLLFSSFAAFSQFAVSGRVVDSASKEPMTGASVYCQNTTVGTTTNKQGEFSLQLKSGGYELIVSYTGYQTKLIRISNNDGKLTDIAVLEEVPMGLFEKP